MIEIIAIQSLILIAFIAFASVRLLNYLHALQQDDYDNGRFFTWVFTNRVFDTRVTVFMIVMAGVYYVADFSYHFTAVPIFLGFALAAYVEKDPRKQSKKALVLTKRAQRILTIALIIASLAGIGAFFTTSPVIWIIAIHFIPFALILGNASLTPHEAQVQKRFYDEARARLDDVQPTIIAITGSYGKTSVKHILGHILKSSAPTLITPGSVNTLMGITRIIREQLQPNHRYFIVEMGAYGPGSISALCALTPPDFGIISAIGHAHYERFKTLDTVAEAKYELATATLARNGKMIVHEKTLKFEYSRNIRNHHMEQFIVCGEPSHIKNPKNEQEFSYLAPDDLHIGSVEQTPKGICVKITWRDAHYTLRAPLYGIHHGHNIALAFACAMTLGMEAKDIRTALASVSQIKHRLEVKKHADGTIIIDDAFNSNPPGFRSAMHVMRVLADDTGGRAILVTPGIVELGGAHDEVHKTLGMLAGDVCDIVLVVSPERIPTFIEGFDTHTHHKTLLQFDTFKQAESWLIDNKQAGDVILLENDLPDIYEQVLKI